MMVGKGENEQKLYNTSFWTWDGLLQCSYTGCFLYRVTEQVAMQQERRPLQGQRSHDEKNRTEVFPCFFLSCKANARVYLTKMGHGPHFPN